MITIYPPHGNQPIFLPRVAKFRIALLGATWGENYGSKMTTNEVCVTVCSGNVWQHVQKIHVPNWFPTVSDWFRLVSHHLFWGLCFKHRESWVIFGGICDEGPPVLDVLIFTFWIYGSCGSWQANFRKSWVWAASPPKLWYPNKTSKSLERATGCQISAGWFGSQSAISPFVLQIFDLGPVCRHQNVEKCWKIRPPQEA